jgi:hypothetical protein
MEFGATSILQGSFELSLRNRLLPHYALEQLFQGCYPGRELL